MSGARRSPGLTKLVTGGGGGEGWGVLIGSYHEQGSGALTEWSVHEDKRPPHAKEVEDHQEPRESVKVLAR